MEKKTNINFKDEMLGSVTFRCHVLETSREKAILAVSNKINLKPFLILLGKNNRTFKTSVIGLNEFFSDIVKLSKINVYNDMLVIEIESQTA